MIEAGNQKLTLDQTATYQIKIPGKLTENRPDWNREIVIKVGNDYNGMPVTVLTATVDQAALQGLLRRLYSLGIPLISVLCVAIEDEGALLYNRHF